MSETKRGPYKESASRKLVRKDLLAGLSPRQIARKRDWSTQNVYIHIRALEKSDERSYWPAR